MRAVAPDRRPPLAAWGLAALSLAPLVVFWAGHRQGWVGSAAESALLWGLVLLGLSFLPFAPLARRFSRKS